MESARGSSIATAEIAHTEAILLDLARASGLEVSPGMLSVILELLRLDVSPQGVVSVLRSLKDAKLKSAAAAAS